MNISDYANLCFTIDTGAMSSIIKCNIIRKGTKVIRDDTEFFGLVKNQQVKAIGRIQTRIIINDTALEHNFFIIKDDINLVNDGIIGRDFLKIYKAKINYFNQIIKFQFPILGHIVRKECKATNTEIEQKHQMSQIEVTVDTEHETVFNKKVKIKNSVTKHIYDPNDFIENLNKNVPEIVSIKSTTQLPKRRKAIRNKDFYASLPDEFFNDEKYERITLKPVKTDEFSTENLMQNETRSFINTPETYVETINISSLFEEEKCEPQTTTNSRLSIKTTSNETTRMQNPTKSRKRENYLEDNIDLKHCSSAEKEDLLGVIKKYNHAFQMPGDKFQHIESYTHRIDLVPGTRPIHIKQYRIPQHDKEEIQRQLNELEHNGIISKCDSPWNSPIFLVPKKENDKGEKQYRLVIDYRELNKVIEPTAYPIPLIDEIIDQMNGCKLFTTLDLCSAYHQIPLENESKPYTAFSTSWEKYCFNSVPFGLVSSPYAWLKTIHNVLKGLIGHNVFVYMDDIIIFSQNFEHHLSILEQVLERLTENKLKLKIDKSKFIKDKVAYLGFIISSEGLMTNPKKVESIVKFPRPTNIKEVQSFLGACNYYRRYIQNYAGLARPLYALCKKDVDFIWDADCENAFSKFKTLLSNPPILIYPDFNKQFILHTDSSDFAVGSVLSQGNIPNDKPIHYFSKILNSAQTKYSTIEKELLAIILAVQNFNCYLTGREFLIVTDHRPLTFLFNSKNINARLHRWKYTLMGYRFRIIYRSGLKNVIADALSRIRIESSKQDEEDTSQNILGFKHIYVQTRNQTKQEINKNKEREVLTERQEKESKELKRPRGRPKKVINPERIIEENSKELSDKNTVDRDDPLNKMSERHENRNQIEQNKNDFSEDETLDDFDYNDPYDVYETNPHEGYEGDITDGSIYEVDEPECLFDGWNELQEESSSDNDDCDDDLISKTRMKKRNLIKPYETPIIEEEEVHENSYSQLRNSDFLKENKDIIVQSNKYDHIFFIFEKENCEMHKKLQHKIKKEIHMENLEPNARYFIDENRTILIMNTLWRSEKDLELIKKGIEIILNICTRANFKNIAINADFNDFKCLFEFKVILYKSFLHKNIKITLCLNKIIEITDKETIKEILNMYHDCLLSGHTGIQRMRANIGRTYHWHGITNDIKNHVKNCPTCEQSKITRHTKNPMVITSTASEPFQKLYVDIVGPINPISIHNNAYIFTCSCSLTKFVIGIAMEDTTALSTAKALVHGVLLKYGLCEEIVSDNGTNFIADTLKEVNKLFKIKRTFTTNFRPQSNQIERFHRFLGEYLKMFIQKEQERWCEYLDFALFAYNNSYNVSTGFSPFELVYGRTSKMPAEITNRTVPIYNYDNYASLLRYKLKQYHDLAKENIKRSKEANKKQYDKNRTPNVLNLKINDLVLLLKFKKKQKFENPYEGPYRVEKIISPEVVVIRKGRKAYKINTERLKLAVADYGENIPPKI